MEDLQSTIQSILSDPEQMRQITVIAESLGLKQPEQNSTTQNPTDAQSERPEGLASRRSEESASSASSVSPNPPGLPDLSALMGSLSAMRGTEDRVFAALRPSLSPSGQAKADRAARAAKLSRLAGRFLMRQRNGHV